MILIASATTPTALPTEGGYVAAFITFAVLALAACAAAATIPAKRHTADVTASTA